MNFDGTGSNLKAAAPGLSGKRVLDLRIVEFTDLAAGLADFEGGDPRMDMPMLRMTADDEGVFALQTVDTAGLQQFFQRP